MIAVVGEALMDVVEESGEVREHAGGGPMNIAVGLARLGCEVDLFSDVGRDRRGEAIRRVLADEGVVLHSPDSPRTSTARARILPDGAAEYDFDVRWSPDVPRFASPPEILHVGSIGAFLAPGDVVVQAAARDADTQTLVSFDPNIRRPFVPSPEEAREVCESLIAASDIVKLSDEDAAYVWPDLEVDDVLDRIVALGPSLAVVTRGGRGATFACAGERLIVEAPRAAVRDTIGAGDSFMSGLLFALRSRGRTDAGPRALRDSLLEAGALAAIGRFAAACAAVTVTRAGAQPPRLEEIEAPVRQPVIQAAGRDRFTSLRES